jgi:RNA polymerase sigma-70 factor (ECF subfamily)
MAESYLDNRSDNDLVKACGAGERAAYARLVRRHYKKVFLVCLGVLGNVHDAEDIAQDTMIKGFEKIRQLRQADQFGPWIAAIARNLSVNALRRKGACDRAAARECPEPAQQEKPNDDLEQAVAGLPWDLRLPLVMYYFDGRSVKAVAEALEISTSGVYLKLRTAIRELQATLGRKGDGS